MNETKSWFFEKVNETNQLLARIIKHKQNKQFTTNRKRQRDITTDSKDSKKIIK